MEMCATEEGRISIHMHNIHAVILFSKFLLYQMSSDYVSSTHYVQNKTKNISEKKKKNRLKHFFTVCIGMLIIIFKNSMLLWQPNNIRLTMTMAWLLGQGVGQALTGITIGSPCVSGLLTSCTDHKGTASPRGWD